MSDEVLQELDRLSREVRALSRRLDAVQADVARIALTAVRFGRDVELRERGY